MEKALVKFKCEHIRSEISIINGLVQLEEYSNLEYLKDHVEGKLKCVIDELDDVIGWKVEESEKKKEEKSPYQWLQGYESVDSMIFSMQKEEIQIPKWLSLIAIRMEKIRKMVSQFSPQAYPKPPFITSEKTVSNTSACIDMCVEESLLISPMIATLKKSYDHLPPNLRLCTLCLAAFPENLVIRKRPLIYWWMAEGFITTEEVGEESFVQLIRVEFIKPVYEDGDSRLGVRGFSVHPWIRRMLVCIAMDAQIFEFYPSGLHRANEIGRATHVCLLEDEDAEAENVRLMMKTRTLRWLKPRLVLCEEEINKEGKISDEREVWDMVFCFQLLLSCVCKLDDDWIRKVWHGDDREALIEKARKLREIIEFHYEKEDDDLHDKLEKWQSELKEVCRWAKQRVHDLDLELQQVNYRRKKREELQRTEQLFAPYHLNNPPCIHHHQWDKALGIINVNQTHLNLEKQVFGGKFNELRTLHLGKCSQGRAYIPHETSNLLLNALFKVAKHLKLLSLPPSISNCCNLQVLDLKNCFELHRLPSEIGLLSKLNHLDVSGCSIWGTNLWKLIAKLKLLRTLKGISLKKKAHFNSLNFKITPTLTELSISIYLDEFINLDRLLNLRVLKMEWWYTHNHHVVLPPQLRKLHLIDYHYPGKTWPTWLMRHPSLETLYITRGNISCFPDDLMLEKLQLLRLEYLSYFYPKYIVEPVISRWFPALKLFLYI